MGAWEAMARELREGLCVEAAEEWVLSGALSQMLSLCAMIVRVSEVQ